MTMLINRKIALSAALILNVAFGALADDLKRNPNGIDSMRKWADHLGREREKIVLSNNKGSPDWALINPGATSWRALGAARQPSPNASSCPLLEGYPDCHY
jgi:hypothetical protein